jgi:indole-3-glycerol phosphate synthase
VGILDEIVANKKREVEQAKELMPFKELEKSSYFAAKTISLKQHLTCANSSGIIAEIKRKSPSKGNINPDISVENISTGYIQAGAAALSILTDKKFFGGTNEDLKIARDKNSCPILRKEFMIDPYQVLEAKSIGADVILLIARILEPKKLKELAQLAVSLSLEVLCEIHQEEELERALIDQVAHVGINSRNLDTLEIDLAAFDILGAKIPDNKIRIAESGISDPSTIRALRAKGFSGFLIGENFMKSPDPAKACKQFIQEAIG